MTPEVDTTLIPGPEPPTDPHIGSPRSANIVDLLNQIQKVLVSSTATPVDSGNDGTNWTFWATFAGHLIVSGFVVFAFSIGSIDFNESIAILGVVWGLAFPSTLKNTK